MISSEWLRCSVALAHAVPGAHLELTLPDQRCLIVSQHPGADLTACQVRRVLLAEAVQHDDVCRRHVEAAALSGSLTSVGPGIYSLPDGSYVLAALLDAPSVCRLLTEGAHADEPNVDVQLLPDPCLGVTVAVVRDAAGPAGVADAVALNLAGVCLAEELSRPNHTSSRN